MILPGLAAAWGRIFFCLNVLLFGCLGLFLFFIGRSHSRQNGIDLFDRHAGRQNNVGGVGEPLNLKFAHSHAGVASALKADGGEQSFGTFGEFEVKETVGFAVLFDDAERLGRGLDLSFRLFGAQ